MTDITITVVLKLSGEERMLADAFVAALNRLADSQQNSGRVAGTAAESNAEKPDALPVARNQQDDFGGRNSNPSPIPKTPPIAAAPQRAAMEAITPAVAPGSAAGGPKAPLPEPTGAAMSAQNGGGSGTEAPAPAAVTCNRLAAGAPPKRQWNAPWATPARVARLRELYPAGANIRAIRADLDKLDGPLLPEATTIANYASQVLGLKRPATEWPTGPTVATKSNEVKRDSESPAAIRASSDRFARAMTFPKVPVDTTTPIPADFDTIRAKAGTWGKQFTSWSDLNAINEHAKHIGHRPFCREMRPA